MANQFGLLSTGFVPMKQQDIISEMQISLQAAFSQNVNLLPNAVFGQLVGIMSEREALLWQVAQAVYASQYPSGAEGTSVDNILALSNLKRLPASASVTSPGENSVPGLVLYGTPGTVIPINSLISVYGQPNSQFQLDAAVTIGSPVNAVETINFSSSPVSGSFNLGITDSSSNNLITGAIAWNALAYQSQINFSGTPVSGQFQLLINGETTANILYSDNAAAFQAKIQALTGFSSATVTGSYSAGFVINWTFASFNPILSFPVNTLGVAITSIDSVQAALNALNDTSVSVSTTANTTNGSNQLSSVGSITGIVVGQTIAGTGIPGGATVLSVSGSIVTMSTNASADGSGIAVIFTGSFPYSDVAVTGSYGTGFTCTFGANTPTTGNSSSGDQAQNLFTVPFISLLNGSSVAVNVLPVLTTAGLPAQAIASATCTVTGPTYAPAGTLTVIDSPVSGWSSVNNPLDVVVGSNIETDTAALTRRKNLLSAQANGPIQAIVEKVQLVSGVTAALGFENLTSAALQVITFSGVPSTGSFSFVINAQSSGAVAYTATSATLQTQLRALHGLPDLTVTGDFLNGFTIDFAGDLGGQPQPLISLITNSLAVSVNFNFGRPGNSFELVVNGGTSQAIATAIYDSKPAGVKSYGNQTVSVTDAFGNPYTIQFSRPTVVPIYVAISLQVSQVTFPLNGIQTIQQDIVTIGNSVGIGGLVIGFGSNGLVGAFNSVPGILSYAMTFGTTSSPSSNANIQLLPEQLALFETFNVSVSLSYV